jgi:hypothetical protein
MVIQVQIIPDPGATQQSKGDFFEDLLRTVMESQRYKVIQRVNFTGTEIDLNCQHLDRPADTALVECKARAVIDSSDIKLFAYDLVVEKRAKYGFFVHTSELRHQAAGLAHTHRDNEFLTFWGPEKVVELLQFVGLISAPPLLPLGPRLTPTKRLLLYAYFGKFWITILSSSIVPSHYTVSSASGVAPSPEALRNISELEELRDLVMWDGPASVPVRERVPSLDAVAEIQEAEQWDDYRPVGSKYFVGRGDVRSKLYSFLRGPNNSSTARRVFFIESKSGWGKSSLIAELRARSRNQRNKNWLYVTAVDSRTANTGAFVGMAFAKLVSSAAEAGFLPPDLSQISIASMYDILASPESTRLLSWLRSNHKVVVVVFDQFEDMFRKADLFQAFHKFMLDVNAEAGNIIVGFSWKTEISVPIDNPAYSLWQQARDISEPFGVDEFLDRDIDRVLRQLEDESGQSLLGDLRRKLKDSSQGFPWLIKRLAIHCLHQLQKGISQEELVDQNLNVDFLMNEDMEALAPEEKRSLKLIARRGYEGDPFDVAEVDEAVGSQVLQALVHKRLVVRSGSKYVVYWDIFRDFLVEDKIPPIGESFLLRQFPTPCIKTMMILLERRTATLGEVLELSPGLTEGTALNWLRELRYLGAITKAHDRDQYTVRPNLSALEDFRLFMQSRLQEHVLARTLVRLEGDSISHEQVMQALKVNFKRYAFGSKTWRTYASYFIAWFSYAGVDFGRRLQLIRKRVRGAAAFIPQWRPEKDCEVFFRFRESDTVQRKKELEKPFYDLRAFGLIEYGAAAASLTKRGANILKLDDNAARREIASAAATLPKLRQAYEAFSQAQASPTETFETRIAPVVASIPSDSYRVVARNVLKSWARFIAGENETPRSREQSLF